MWERMPEMLIIITIIIIIRLLGIHSKYHIMNKCGIFGPPSHTEDLHNIRLSGKAVRRYMTLRSIKGLVVACDAVHAAQGC